MTDKVEQKRRIAITEIRNKITTLEKSQKRDTDALENIPNMKYSEEMAIIKRNKYNSDISRREVEIQELTLRIQNITSGQEDQKMNENAVALREAQKQRTQEMLKKKKEISLEDEDKQKRVQEKFYGKERAPDEKYLQKDYAYHYKLFLKSIELLPPYMQKNLERWPGNKGYAFRGCIHYGYLPEESDTQIIFDRIDGVQHIRETTPTEIRLYSKPSKDHPKVLVSVKKRNIKTCTANRYDPPPKPNYGGGNNSSYERGNGSYGNRQNQGYSGNRGNQRSIFSSRKNDESNAPISQLKPTSNRPQNRWTKSNPRDVRTDSRKK